MVLPDFSALYTTTAQAAAASAAKKVHREDRGMCRCTRCTSRSKTGSPVSFRTFQLHLNQFSTPRRSLLPILKRTNPPRPTTASLPLRSHLRQAHHPAYASTTEWDQVNAEVDELPAEGGDKIDQDEEEFTGSLADFLARSRGEGILEAAVHEETAAITAGEEGTLDESTWEDAAIEARLSSANFHQDALSTTHDPPVIHHASITGGYVDLVKAGLPFTIHPSLSLPPPARKDKSSTSIPFVERAFLSLFAVQLVFWNTPKRCIEFGMKATWIILRAICLAMEASWIARQTLNDPGQFNSSLLPEGSFLSGSPPISVQTLRKRTGLDGILVLHPTCPNHHCHHVFHDVTSLEGIRQIGERCGCGERLRIDDKVQTLVFARQFLLHELERVLAVPGIEELCFNWAERRGKQRREDAWHQQTIYRDRYDGSAFDDVNHPETGEPLNPDVEDVIYLDLGLDWFNPCDSRTTRAQSIGPIIVTIANLPLRLHTSMSLIMVVGITPGPHEPKSENLWQFTLPIAMELRNAWLRPVTLVTPARPRGRNVRIVLSAIIADRIGAHSITGAPHRSNPDDFCSRCLAKKSELSTTFHFPTRDARSQTDRVIARERNLPLDLRMEELQWDQREGETATQRINDMLDAPGDKRRRQTLQPYNKKPYPQAKRLAFIKLKRREAKGNVSAFDALPYLDKFQAAVHDPMHLLLLGLVKTFVWGVLVKGEYRSSLQTASLDDSDSENEDHQAGEIEIDEGCLSDTSTTSRLSALSTPNAAKRARPNANSTSTATDRDTSNAYPRNKSGQVANRILTEEHLAMLRDLIAETTIPSCMEKIHPEFMSGSSGTAASWWTFAEGYAGLCWPELFIRESGTAHRSKRASLKMTRAELKLQMMVVDLVVLVMRPAISACQVRRLKASIEPFQRLAYSMHPGLARTDNLHAIRHLPEDIERYGPVYGWWSFLAERVNKLLKNMNTNNHREDATVIMLNGFARLSRVGMISQNLTTSATDPAEQDCAAAFRDLLTSTAASGSSTNGQEQVSAWWSEDSTARDRSIADIQYRRDGTPVTSGRMTSSILSEGELQVLQKAIKRRMKLDSLHEDEFEAIKACPGHIILQPACKSVPCLRIGFKTFRASLEDPFSNGGMLARPGIKLQDCFFALKSELDVFECKHQRDRVGIIIKLFTYSATSADGSNSVSSTFALVRMLQPWLLSDPYEFAASPHLLRFLWRMDQATPLTVLTMDTAFCAAMRPVVTKAMDRDPTNPALGKIFATQTVTR